MTDRRPSSGPVLWAVAALGLLAYVPALTAAPGRMPADSKLYLYLDPGRFLGDAASTFDPRQFAGWVPHQHVAYLWPTGPWYWLFDLLAFPDWIAHRLWIGTVLLAGGLGVRWCARVLGLGQVAAIVAAIVYQTSPYLLPYVSRTSVMLLPWAGLGWIVALTVRATRRHSWRDPALIALVVLTVGAVNATALAMIVPAPVLWLLHAAWQRSVSWRDAAVVATRVVLLTVPVCAWWVVMLVVQGRYGAEVLPYSESLADVSLTATAPEVWRSLGYWLFYVRDGELATTTESLRYLSSTPAIAVSYLLPIVGVAGLAFTRWAHRRYAALLVVAGAVLAVGVHPIGDRSPLMRILAGDDEGGLALALRSSTRALPVMSLGLALGAALLVSAFETTRLRRVAVPANRLAGAAVVVLALANLPALWTGGFVDPAIDRDQDPPAAWTEAAAALDASGTLGRVLQVPGAEFGAFEWGYTVDQPLPGLTDKPLVTRDLLPLGAPGAMDLLYALDDRMQDGVLEPGSVAPVARWLGVDTVWVAHDLDDERFRTADPESVDAVLATADGIGEPRSFGPGAVPTVTLRPVEEPGAVVRAGSRTVVVSGSGDGLVDLAAAGLLDATEVVRYSASPAGTTLPVDAGTPLLVTDSNRDRARHWRSSQDTLGATESDQSGLDLLRPVASDQRLPVFAARGVEVDPATQTVARQVGAVRATATSYGEPFAYLPERRPVMAIDGDPATAWTVGEHADPVGEVLRLISDVPLGQIGLVQADPGAGRRITEVLVSADSRPPQRIAIDDRSLAAPGMPVDLGGALTIDIEIAAVGGGTPFTAGAAQGVGFAEVTTGVPPTVEVVRPPHDALSAADASTPLALVFTRWRADAGDPWRADPEPRLVRGVDLPTAREFDVSLDVRIDPRAPDAALAELFGWPVVASSRRLGELEHAGAAALDGDATTAWITQDGEAVGARLIVAGVTEPVARITVEQPEGWSRITDVVVRVGADARQVVLDPGTGSATLVPPLPPGTVEVEITAVEPVTVVDRRYLDVVERGAAVSELVLAGAPSTAGFASSTATLDCVALLDVDGEPRRFSAEVDVSAAIQGRAFRADPCDGALALAAGPHTVTGLADGAVVVDRVVLDDGAKAAIDEPRERAGSAPVARLVRDGRFDRSVELTGCTEGCWLVLGEGFSTGWSAEAAGVGLGEPVLVDSGFNGWWIPSAPDGTVIDLHWSQQRRLVIALVVSLLGALVAAALAILAGPRGAPPVASAPRPRWHWLPVDLPVVPVRRRRLLGVLGVVSSGFERRSIVLTVGWAALAGVLIQPEWAVWGAIAGFIAALWQRPRLPELTALATLVAVAGLVVVRERRNAPAPGGGWPGVFETWHGLALFAVVALLVGALVADDAAWRRTLPVDETHPVSDPVRSPVSDTGGGGV